jgi:hypothetical protein
MARLLENQAGQLLKEQSTMAAGDVEGFASVAFPIVRRVFGNLLAQDLVSVQPMSLPSGLIFFLDFTVAPTAALVDNGTGLATRFARSRANESLYGGGKSRAQIVVNGLDLAGDARTKSFYNLNNWVQQPDRFGDRPTPVR